MSFLNNISALAGKSTTSMHEDGPFFHFSAVWPFSGGHDIVWGWFVKLMKKTHVFRLQCGGKPLN
jgi:hypothetical protein